MPTGESDADYGKEPFFRPPHFTTIAANTPVGRKARDAIAVSNKKKDLSKAAKKRLLASRKD